MSFKEKSTWIMAVITSVAYAGYLETILGRTGDGALTEVPYVSTLLWTIGAVILASIVAHIAVAIASPNEAGKEDRRDQEIDRHGEYAGNWFVVVGALAALGMSMVEISHFWIANIIYLAFVLGTLFGSAVKILAYRRGFQQW